MLEKKYRITKQKEFDQFFGQNFKKLGGRSVSTKEFVFKYYENGQKLSRFAFITSNKLDNRATVRNKLRRQLRDVVRLNLLKLKKNVDVLLVCQKPILKLDYEQLEQAMVSAAKKARLL
jgi:ribonuclease P protein component